MYGTCRFCGNKRIVEAPEDTPTVELDAIATEECDCDAATLERKLEKEAEIAKLNIDNLFSEKHPEAAELLRKSVTFIQHGRIKSIGIQITPKIKANLKRTSKDSIAVERIYKNKEELDTE